MNQLSEDVEDAPELSESLVGLVGAFDRLKETMGFAEDGDEQMQEIQKFVEEIQSENMKLRQHAEDAIFMAQMYQQETIVLAEENGNLMDQLTQAKLSDMVSNTQALTTVAYEYDKEIVMAKIAQAEEIMVQFQELQERVDELEEENSGLKETLHEMREDQKQIRKLQALEGKDILVDGGTPWMGDSQLEGEQDRIYVGNLEKAADDVRQKNPVDVEAGDEDVVLFATPQSKLAVEENAIMTPLSVQKDDPVALAEALDAVAGGSEAGVAAAASKMLRNYHTMQNDLEETKAKNVELASEIEELTETMTSKAFKAPSAWAEREVKYKLDKKVWEEEIMSLNSKIEILEAENKDLKTMHGTEELDNKIIGLEATVLELRRERDNALAQLHEMQVSSLARAGEFSATGVRPVAHSEDDVKSIVDKIESASESKGGSFSASDAGTMQSPAALEQKRIERELMAVQQEQEDLHAELAALLAKETIDLPVSRDNLDEKNISILKNQMEMALIQSGIDVEMSAKLAELEANFSEAQERERTAVTMLKQLKIENHLDENGDMQANKIASIQQEQEDIQQEIESLVANINLSNVAAFEQSENKNVATSKVASILKNSTPEKIGVTETKEKNVNQDKQESMVLSELATTRLSELKAETEAMKQVEDKISANNSSTELGGEDLMKNTRAAAEFAALSRQQQTKIEELREMLQEAAAREAKLKSDMESLYTKAVPTKKSTAAAGIHDSQEATSINESKLKFDRQDADAAWEDHRKKHEMNTLLRDKAALETKCELLKSQLAKAQAALAASEEERKHFQIIIDDTVRTGDVTKLSQMKKEKSKAKSSSPLKRLRGKSIFGRKSANQKAKNAELEHVEETEFENLRYKSAEKTAQEALPPIVTPKPGNQSSEDQEISALSLEQELQSIRDENEMLMDQLVTTKVRLAEVEGDCLQSRRALLRAHEKQVQLAKQLQKQNT